MKIEAQPVLDQVEELEVSVTITMKIREWTAVKNILQQGLGQQWHNGVSDFRISLSDMIRTFTERIVGK